jgi:hypothetical protein
MYKWISRQQPTVPTTTPLVLKTFLPNNEIRRAKLSVATFKQLEEALATTYLSGDDLDCNLILKYRDERNDWITFDTEEEFQDAIEVLRYEQSKNPTTALCVSITVGEKKPVEVVVQEVVVTAPTILDVVEAAEEAPVEPIVEEESQIEEVEVLITKSPVVDSVGDLLPNIDESYIVVEPTIESKTIDTEDDYSSEEYSSRSVSSTDSSVESYDVERLRESANLLSQSIGSFLQQAPQPVRPLPEANYDEESEIEQVTSVKSVVPVVEPVVEQEPVVEAPKVSIPTQYTEQVEFLREMGIEITQENVDRLLKHKGNVSALVESIFKN